MNELVQQLHGQALDKAVPETWTELSPRQLEKFSQAFAMLLINECFVKLTPYMDDQFIDDIETELKQHFGMKQ